MHDDHDNGHDNGPKTGPETGLQTGLPDDSGNKAGPAPAPARSSGNDPADPLDPGTDPGASRVPLPRSHAPVDARAERRKRSQRTGERLLEAGRKLVLRDGMSSQMPVRVSDVVASVGQTTGAAYQIWPSQDRFQDALAAYMVEHSVWTQPVEQLEALHNELDAGFDSFPEFMRRVALALLGCLAGNPEYYLQLHFDAVAFHETTLRTAMRRNYETYHHAVTGLVEKAMAHFEVGSEPSRGVDDLIATITAVAEGFAIRSLIDGHRLIRPEHPAALPADELDAAHPADSSDASHAPGGPLPSQVPPRPTLPASGWPLYLATVDAVVRSFTAPLAPPSD